MTCDGEFLIGEQGRQEVERDAVANLFGTTAVDKVDFHQGEELLLALRRTDGALHGVASLQAKELDLRSGNVNVIG